MGPLAFCHPAFCSSSTPSFAHVCWRTTARPRVQGGMKTGIRKTKGSSRKDTNARRLQSESKGSSAAVSAEVASTSLMSLKYEHAQRQSSLAAARTLTSLSTNFIRAHGSSSTTSMRQTTAHASCDCCVNFASRPEGGTPCNCI